MTTDATKPAKLTGVISRERSGLVGQLAVELERSASDSIGLVMIMLMEVFICAHYAPLVVV